MNLETSELCDQYGPQVQVADGRLRHFGGRTQFHGAVVTLRVDADFGLVKTTLGNPGENRVLVVDGGGATNYALLGDRLAQMALNGSWAGIVINGHIRDSAIIAGLDIGVMALGTCPRRPALTGEGETDITVSFAGADIHPGDWLYADLDGVVVSRTPLHP